MKWRCFRDIVVTAIDLWCKRHEPEEELLEEEVEEEVEEEIEEEEEEGDDRPAVRPSKGPHPEELCEMCRALGRGCWQKK